ncbi:hypothetical protein HAV15_006687 [Penicillium sp. str. |nr:hypothetical protein HAV15_006687 [Penicillium sp. str. \
MRYYRVSNFNKRGSIGSYEYAIQRRSPKRQLHVLQTVALGDFYMPIAPIQRIFPLQLHHTNYHRALPCNSIAYIPNSMRLFLNTEPPSLHLASDILDIRTRPSPRHPPNPIPAHPPLDSQSIQMPNLPSRYTNTLPGEYGLIPTAEMDARLDLYMRDALRLSGDSAWEISWFHWHGNDGY